MRISDWSSDVCSSDLHAPELTIAPDIFAKKLDRIHNGMWPQASGNVCILKVSFQPSGARCLGNKRTTSTPGSRSEERRVGQVCVITGRSWWSTCPKKNKSNNRWGLSSRTKQHN